ncbi:hypothetical protein C2S52_019217 [Perilla frutescens var. hirtella]|nr:hypothetical protein C2S52_019217 [Perilla frutescens var. hirtella]KAH6806495.1 hypothetical protein C2S51_031326 [Perilla frutescens var. frutescens]
MGNSYVDAAFTIPHSSLSILSLQLMLIFSIIQTKLEILRADADMGDIFEGEVRRAELPLGFEERGNVVRDWARRDEVACSVTVEEGVRRD